MISFLVILLTLNRTYAASVIYNEAYFWNIHWVTALWGAGVTARQFELKSLMPLPVGSCGRLQLRSSFQLGDFGIITDEVDAWNTINCSGYFSGKLLIIELITFTIILS